MAGALALGLFVLGPWPSLGGSYEGTEFELRTLERLASRPEPVLRAAPLEVGVAELDITPEPGHPLAGYGSRAPNVSTAIETRCFARALSLRAGSVTVTLLAADILIVDRALSEAVLERAGLAPEALYFTASHTHSGPGGWGAHPVERLLAGDFDPRYFERLVESFTELIVRSRERLAPAEVAFASARVPEALRPRIDASVEPDDRLMALVFRAPHGSGGDPPAPTAILVVFGAHATVMRSNDLVISAGYPGGLGDELRARTGAGTVLFAAGAVGDAGPRRPAAPTSAEAVRRYAETLADELTPELLEAEFRRTVVLASERLDVDLPSLRVHVSPRWRLSPILTSWLTDRRTWLHTLRVGPALLIGFPGDYAGHLATRLARSTGSSTPTLLCTSFNGDYKGYLVSSETFRAHGGYETRTMSFFGPSGGDYVTDLARRMADRLVDDSEHEAE